jgi:hypothetical protein
MRKWILITILMVVLVPANGLAQKKSLISGTPMAVNWERK